VLLDQFYILWVTDCSQVTALQPELEAIRVLSDHVVDGLVVLKIETSEAFDSLLICFKGLCDVYTLIPDD